MVGQVTNISAGYLIASVDAIGCEWIALAVLGVDDHSSQRAYGHQYYQTRNVDPHGTETPSKIPHFSDRVTDIKAERMNLSQPINQSINQKIPLAENVTSDLQKNWTEAYNRTTIDV